ncbi:MAG: hypothetical protein D6705_16990 [Deltaproteobacteria bacterium]|nr:MAG: hypothetical protein D6705_16990 [Deltaproteobacteria bacterium]
MRLAVRVLPHVLVAVVSLASCTIEGKRPASRSHGPANASQVADGATTVGDAREGDLGRVLPDAPFPIEAMLGASPQRVEQQLGEPLGKGMMRKSCVRFVPERTWFSCAYAEQRYADPSGRFGAVGVEYTDGRATSLWWERIPGTGPFDPAEALRIVGLELPGEPTVRHPKPNITVYEYFNHVARLRIHGKEYRAEVSVIDDDWQHSKVQIWQNDHLTPDQASRRIETGRAPSPP